MIRKTLLLLILPVVATAALLGSAGPALAQRGGFHAGGGVYHGGVSRGGFGGYRPYYRGYGTYPYYRDWYSPYYYGGWSYPYYGSGYYPYSYGIGYDAPSASDATSDPDTPPAQAPRRGYREHLHPGAARLTRLTARPTSPCNSPATRTSGSMAHR
jgi:hypothetical protein